MQLLQRDDAHNDALLGRDILDLELPFAGLQGGSLLEGLLPKQPVDHTEAQDVCGVGIPLDDYGTILSEGVLHLHLVGIVDPGSPLRRISQDKWWPLWLVETRAACAVAIAIGHSLPPSRCLFAISMARGRRGGGGGRGAAARGDGGGMDCSRAIHRKIRWWRGGGGSRDSRRSFGGWSSLEDWKYLLIQWRFTLSLHIILLNSRVLLILLSDHSPCCASLLAPAWWLWLSLWVSLLKSRGCSHCCQREKRRLCQYLRHCSFQFPHPCPCPFHIPRSRGRPIASASGYRPDRRDHEGPHRRCPDSSAPRAESNRSHGPGSGVECHRTVGSVPAMLPKGRKREAQLAS